MLLAFVALLTGAGAAPPTMADVLAAAKPSDWRALDPENTLYLELTAGRVVIELAPGIAPRHVANIKTLARQSYFDGLVFMRSQDNYVVQWGDPDGKKTMGTAHKRLPAELTVAAAGQPFTRLEARDAYAHLVGFLAGFPAARDTAHLWLAHCYGMVGAGRDDAADSGNGSELYVVIGHAPRHLDRNVTLVGRVVKGIEILSVLPRGTGALGFYEKPEHHVPIASIKVAADVPEATRTHLEILRTDTATFTALVESRRHRRESWFLHPAGNIELCNVPLPVRARP
jgi:peptidylprolyl isomerase